ncbi:Serine/threonine-protein kinase RAD53 [Escovopsis weberi]|uniref:Autophagy-related protein 1 n=1 Tax=Escovopsis weberi TaxID=150374 RepID=A0A0M8MVI1_ESCWE|nr:Serine/threonine-protein kinase RAD53 [Escovopsis weberi]
MDGDDNDPTQATQNILDPRRIGKQNSGFSDDAISDIICILYPHSEAARNEVQRLAAEKSPHVIGKDEADGVEPDYDIEDHPSRFPAKPSADGNHAIILRLSSPVKHPAMGFAFGRNGSKCDVVFANDPLKRVSNVHFRIYVNEFGNVMIEDHSTNGTRLDQHLLFSHPHPPDVKPAPSKWVLSSGAIIGIFLHQEQWDLKFQVRIPRRDDEYDRAYLQNVADYYARHGIRGPIETVGPGPGGHVDLFRAANPATYSAAPGAQGSPRATTETPERLLTPASAESARPSPRRALGPQGAVKRDWSGSDKYNKVRMIGKGAFAVVYKVTSKYDGRPYAAKELDKRRFVKDGVLDAKAENEMRIMKKVQHPNIVQYIEHIEWDARLLIIIMEFVPGGDLGKLIADEGILPEKTAKLVSQQLLSALGYLHEQQITHRDIKPDNILINRTEPLEVKLTDFGLSKMIDKEQTFLRTFCGTLLYCAPEVYTEYVEYDDNGHRNRGKRSRRAPGPRYSHAVDIWSLGGVLFYTLTGAPPYPVKTGISYSELLHQIMTKTLNVQPLHSEDVSLTGIDFLSRMLERRPEVRATVQELVNHSWLSASASTIKPAESFDEVSDDDEEEQVRFQPSQDLGKLDDFDEIEDDRISDSIEGDDDEEQQVQREIMEQMEQMQQMEDERSDKENRGGGPPLKLFGEVGASGIGGAGKVHEDYYLNLQTSGGSWDASSSHASGQTYHPTAPSAAQTRRRRDSAQTRASVANQSTDQLQSLVENVASQSLGDSEPATRDRDRASSLHSTSSVDLNASKRKPQSSFESSDEFEFAAPSEEPAIKRLKSDANLDNVSGEIIEEYRLLARVPQVQRLWGRQLDGPVDKQVYWEQDPRTWHLNYPEMTKLQQHAFVQAAKAANEEFGPGRTPLWNLAMKYFPPMSSAERRRRRGAATSPAADGHEMDLPVALTSTSSKPSLEAALAPESRNANKPEPLAIIKSDADSDLKSISIVMADTLVSFGRDPINTQVFEPVTENRVPKHAFKILLWKDGFDPSKNPSKTPPPWARKTPNPDADSYHCWISTKATLGIKINERPLLSSNTHKDPRGSLTHWAKLHDGDSLTIWFGRPSDHTKLTFRCFWGGSARPRPAAGAGAPPQLEMASSAVARQLDQACQAAERRIERNRKLSAAQAEHQAEYLERLRHAEGELARSRAFERRREEALRFLGPQRDSAAAAGSGRLHAMHGTV